MTLEQEGEIVEQYFTFNQDGARMYLLSIKVTKIFSLKISQCVGDEKTQNSSYPDPPTAPVRVSRVISWKMKSHPNFCQ